MSLDMITIIMFHRTSLSLNCKLTLVAGLQIVNFNFKF